MKIFLDIDETLVHSMPLVGRLPKGYEIVSSHNEYASKLRPHAKEFIEAVSELGDVAFLTAGTEDFQRKVLKTHGIEEFPIYGRDKLGKKLFDEDFILVDDQEDGDMNMFNKLKTAGAISEVQSMFSIGGPEKATKAYNEHVIHTVPFRGNSEDNVLLDILEKIKQKLSDKSPE